MNYHFLIEGRRRNNLGDVLQGMVGRQFLPHSSTAVDRERTREMSAVMPSLLLANGWFIHDRRSFPPPEAVTPIYLSVHIDNLRWLREPEVRAHLRRYAPIGCRDRKTLLLLWGWGIPAYYSGCLTLTTNTLPINALPDSGERLLVDGIDHPLPTAVVDALERLLGGALTRVSHDVPNPEGDFDDYCTRTVEVMSDLLARYRAASLVVTSKIHCALPCLALGVPVLLVHPHPRERRLDPVRELIRIWSYEEVLTATSLPLPVVRQRLLERRRRRLVALVRDSVKRRCNAVQHPATVEQLLLNWQAFAAAWIAGHLLSVLRRFPPLGVKLSRWF